MNRDSRKPSNTKCIYESGFLCTNQEAVLNTHRCMGNGCKYFDNGYSQNNRYEIEHNDVQIDVAKSIIRSNAKLVKEPVPSNKNKGGMSFRERKYINYHARKEILQKASDCKFNHDGLGCYLFDNEYNRSSCKEADTCQSFQPKSNDDKFEDIKFDIYSLNMEDNIDCKRSAELNKLGEVYYKNKKYKDSFDFFVEAAQLGNASAQFNLGQCYFYGLGVKIDKPTAYRIYQFAAAQDLAIAILSLGNCYYFGDGVLKNFHKAIEYYEKAAAQGMAAAYYQLGCCHSYGNGTRENDNIAFMNFKKSAEMGVVDAQYMMGVSYQYGKGTQRNLFEALKWYKLAKSRGSKKAVKALEHIEMKLL